MITRRNHRRVFSLLVLLLLPILTGITLTTTVTVFAGVREEGFHLEYPTAARPAKVIRKFVKPAPGKTPYEGVDLLSPGGSSVLAGAAGKVKKVVLSEDGHGWGAYVQVVTNVNDIKYKVTYGSLKNIVVTAGQQVTQGAWLGKSADGVLKIVIQSPQGGLSGFQVPNVINPKPIIRLDGIRLRPTDNNLRLRAAPNTDAEVLGQVSQWDFLRTPDSDYKAMQKAGKDGAWLRVRMDNDQIAYAFAYYLKVVSIHDPVEGLPGIPMRGMNLDRYQPLGNPAATPLINLGWVRLSYNVSYNPDNGSYGNTDLNAAFARYYPVIKQYADSGNKVILVLTHQFYGEGQGYDWHNMSPEQWAALTAQYAAMAGQVAAQ
ncbi:MAG TPA: peptidoglycan DD-metalloendopeptidase family protein, partial [Phototrophicaceae bacterium]|nr:peptidoglycan DD-metalloendopeptidase family protein [Phototrophicaceae bacterium]